MENDRMSRSAWQWPSECDELASHWDKTLVTKCLAVGAKNM